MATKTKKTTAVPVDMSDVMVEADEKVSIDVTKTSAAVVRIDDAALVNVRSNVFGELIFVDPVTKEVITWPQCGEVLPIPMSTLRHMKTGASKFFSNQLVVLTGFADENADKYEVADIYKALYISQYYKEIIDPANYEEISNWKPSEIKEKVSMMSKGARAKLLVSLNTYIEKGVLDSLKAIKAFEEALGCELMRPE